jgi:hypothetical protein
MTEPSVDELQALVERLASADLDSALELSRLIAATQQLGELAEQLVQRGRAPIALAWLRRITREVDTLQALWHRSHAQDIEPRPQPRERRKPAGQPAANQD